MALRNAICDREYDKFIENPKDQGTDLRTNDKCAHDILNDILTELGGSAGTPFFTDVDTVTTGSPQTLINITVPAATTRKLKKIFVSSGVEGVYRVTLNSVLIGGGRIGPGNPNSEFKFDPVRDTVTGDVIKVDFEPVHGPNSDINAHLMATDF